MKKYSILVLLSLFTLIASAQQQRVILISIDGFRPDFYLDKKWPAPNLQRLAKMGVNSPGVQSVFPSITYPSHTSIITGANPIHHGIYFNNVVGGKAKENIWYDNLIKTPTIWSALHQNGLTSAAVMWPVSVGAKIDYNFPTLRSEGDKTIDQVEVTRPHITPIDLFDEYEKNFGKINPKDFKAVNGNKHAQDKAVKKMSMYIFKKHKPSLTAIHFLSMDHAQHDHGREGREVEESLAIIDGLIGQIIDEVKSLGMEKNTTIIITGDHGFVNTNGLFSPNVLLKENGLFSNTKKYKAKFDSAGGSTFLYVKDNNPDVLKQVLALLNKLPEEEKKLFRILDRDELDKAGANPDAMLALTLKPGLKSTDKFNDIKLISSKKMGGNHGYFPDFHEIQTGFIAVGPNIQTQKVVENLGIIDIAPLIAKILNVEFKAPDGKLVPGILKKN